MVDMDLEAITPFYLVRKSGEYCKRESDPLDNQAWGHAKPEGENQHLKLHLDVNWQQCSSQNSGLIQVYWNASITVQTPTFGAIL